MCRKPFSLFLLSILLLLLPATGHANLLYDEKDIEQGALPVDIEPHIQDSNLQQKKQMLFSVLAPTKKLSKGESIKINISAQNQTNKTLKNVKLCYRGAKGLAPVGKSQGRICWNKRSVRAYRSLNVYLVLKVKKTNGGYWQSPVSLKAKGIHMQTKVAKIYTK